MTGGARDGGGRPRVVLTIAGSDSSGGAGIAADLKTFHALGVHGAVAVTAVTAQDTTGVAAVHPVPPGVVAQQVARVAADLGLDAAKTGMLASAAVAGAVADAVEAHGITPLVVDPVLAAGTGRALLDKAGLDVLRRRLLPLAAVVTPNLAEAAALVRHPVTTLDEMRAAAEALAAMGPAAVLVTGGHLRGDPVDVLHDGTRLHELTGERVTAGAGGGPVGTHGGGCTLSAALAAHLACGLPIHDAVQAARAFTAAAIRHALALGRGEGPVDPGARVRVPGGGTGVR